MSTNNFTIGQTVSSTRGLYGGRLFRIDDILGGVYWLRSVQSGAGGEDDIILQLDDQSMAAEGFRLGYNPVTPSGSADIPRPSVTNKYKIGDRLVHRPNIDYPYTIAALNPTFYFMITRDSGSNTESHPVYEVDDPSGSWQVYDPSIIPIPPAPAPAPIIGPPYNPPAPAPAPIIGPPYNPPAPFGAGMFIGSLALLFAITRKRKH